jgi:hypothetical protein
MSDALDRLSDIGFEQGSGLVNHAPMAAEALATLGYTDTLATWVQHNLSIRHYEARPKPGWALSGDDETEWRPALGDFSRAADWAALFERELSEQAWNTVLCKWWPRLLPGMSAVLAHGVIRTAHAVRSLVQASADNHLQRVELAQGLALWASRYDRSDPSDEADQVGGAGAVPALDEIIVESAGHYARSVREHPVPLIHAITGPAAVRLLCQFLPDDQRLPASIAAKRSSDDIRGRFGTQETGTPPLAATDQTEADIVAEAVEVGDEHAIKLAEVAVRHNSLSPDMRYAAASHAATSQIRRFLSEEGTFD